MIAPQKVRIFLVLTVLVAVGLMWAIGDWVISVDGRSGSILAQPSPLSSMLLTFVGGVITCIAGAFVAGGVRPLAGIFAAGIGLLALAARGGRMTFVVQAASSRSVFLLLALELTLLAILLGLCWWLSEGIRPAKSVPHNEEDDDTPSLHHTLVALATSVVAMGVMMWLLGQADAKVQALAAVGVSAYVATWLACQVGPVRAAAWSWTAPLVVGVVGYLMATQMPGDWRIGFVRHPLIIATPLDYASVGPVAALLSYWANRRWRDEGEESQIKPATPAQAA